MPRKDENLSRYLSDMVRYGYWTNDELKRVQDTPMPPIEHWSREYQLEAQVRHVRYQMQLDDIDGMVYVVPHYACRPSHIEYQGKAYRRSTFDNDIAYPNNPDGIGCANCRHEVVAYYRGIDAQYDESLRNTDELIKQYNDEQTMRYYERSIRKLKLAGDGNDESIRNYYAKMMKHSRDTNTPIQINRTWTISASRYNVGMPNRRLDMMNLLPRVTNESFDYGFVKTTARMSGKRKSYLIDGIDISEINFAPESIRTAYTGRAYGISRAMTEEAYKSSLETLLHTSANSYGTEIIWADKTTSNLLNATGCFYIPKNTDVDSINPFDVYDDFKRYQTTDLLPTSYGIYVDNNDVWRFFYGDKVESDTIYDFSRKPNRQKVSAKIMDTSIKSFDEASGAVLSKEIKDYLDDKLTNLNDELRKGHLWKQTEQDANVIESYLKPIDKNIRVYRYIDDTTYGKMIKDKTESYELGFANTSLSKLKKDGVELRIDVPKGTKALFTSESELMLDRALEFEIKSEAIENGKKVVCLKIKEPQILQHYNDLPPEIELFNKSLLDRRYALSVKIDYQHLYSRPVTKLSKIETEEETIKALGGRDKTGGSCMTLGLAWILRRKAKLDILDFRGGSNQETIGSWFAIGSHSQDFFTQLGGKNLMPDSSVGLRAVKKLKDGEQGILLYGRHCTIVKYENKQIYYLELQGNELDNGWIPCTSKELKLRCSRGIGYSGDWNALYSLDDLQITDDIASAIGECFNTDSDKRKIGKGGGIK